MKLLFLKLCLVLFCFMSTTITANEKIYLTSLDWPPYSGKSLPDQGASIAVAKAAFKAMDYELIVDFFPWSRAVYLAKEPDSKYAGYFPEYYAKDIEQTFIFSAEMGNGPLGFVQNKSKPISWETLDDLSTYAIGTVRDYVNTTEFDLRANDGRLTVKPVTSDLQNIRKLAAERLQLAVIDKNVLSYLLETEPKLKEFQDKVEFNPKLLEDKSLYVCFRKGALGQKLTKVFNEGLKKINIKEIMSKHLED